MGNFVFVLSLGLAAFCVVLASGVFVTGAVLQKANKAAVAQKFSFQNTMFLVALGYLLTLVGLVSKLVSL